MKDIKIAAAYIRVSTDDQIEYSPDAQLFEIRKYASANGFIIPDEFVYTDEGISGRSAKKRPAFNDMIAAAKTKPTPFDAILVWKFSRFARNQEESIVYKAMLRKDGVDVISVSEPLAEGPFGSLIERILEWMDEYYSIRLSGEVKRGMTEKARRGERQTIASFGYRLENHKLIPDEKEAPIVRHIFEEFVSGKGLFPIAKELNAAGVRTHRNNRFENRTVEYILRNPVYIGKLRWNPAGKTKRDFTNENIILADAAHQPLVDIDTWDAAQKRMLEVKQQWGYKARPTHELKTWMSGLVRCASCGTTLIFSHPHYYKCNNFVRGSCKTSQHISAAKLEKAIIERLQSDADTGNLLNYETSHNSEKRRSDEEIYTSNIASLERKLNRLREAYLSGAESLEDYKASKSDIESAIDSEKNKLAELENRAQNVNAQAILSDAIKAALKVLTNPNATKEEKNSAARSIIHRATLDKEKNLLTITYRLTV